jgi:hypothetical protein
MDLAAFAEKRFARWGWMELGAAFALAAVVFAAVVLALGGRLDGLRQRTATGGAEPRIVSYMLDMRDPRGFVDPARVPQVEGAFDLAIVVDSSFLTIDAPRERTYRGQNRYKLTPLVAAHMTAIDGRPLVLHEYFQPGTRTFDRRQAVLRAIADPRIDAVVISVNPFLFFNDYMAFENTSHRMRMLDLPGLAMSDYRLLALTTRPGLLLMEALAAVSPLHDLRFPVLQATLNAMRRAMPLNLPFPVYERGRGGVFYMVTRWISWLHPREAREAARKNPATAFLGSALQTSNLSSGSVGETSLRATLRDLKAWGKPAIFYVPPINPAFRGSPNWPMLLYIVRHFQLIVLQADAPNVRMETSSTAAVLKDVVYHDPYHLKAPVGMVRLFADIVEKHLKLPVTRAPFEHLIGPSDPAAPMAAAPRPTASQETSAP